MINQTILAFDVGSHKIGVAVGQTLLRSATPLARLPAKQGLPDKQAIKKLIRAWRPHVILVGLPTKMDGSEQFTTELALSFAGFLSTQTDAAIHLVDERLTTKSARSELFAQGGLKKLRKADVDGYAAKILIESWVNEQALSI